MEGINPTLAPSGTLLRSWTSEAHGLFLVLRGVARRGHKAG